MTGNKDWPITVALNNMAGSQIISWNVQMAGSLLAALPTLLVYIFLGRYFLRGLLAGSLKGYNAHGHFMPVGYKLRFPPF
ncbi:MAG: hypothetical protein Q8L87_00170 [Anaerolineales bacterium]|nr:hypothetical protein [Anaerolineales bacterium]